MKRVAHLLDSMQLFIGTIGRKTLHAVDHALKLCALAYRMLQLVVRGSARGKVMVRRIVIEQIYFTAVQALAVIVPVALLTGSMILLQVARISVQYSFSRTAIILIIRELGPIVTALVVILRTATAVTIEIGYMRVLGEFEAIELNGIDPMRVICGPRLVGITTALICLFVVFDVVAIAGGYLAVWLMTRIPLANFLDQIMKSLSPSDLSVGFIKAVFFGLAITTTCLLRGFEVGKRINEVPMATSKAAVESFMYCIVINIFVSLVSYI